MNVRYRIASIAIAAIVIGISGCELGSPELAVESAVTPADLLDSGPRCGTQPPSACLQRCGGQPTGLAPWCQDGRWVCDQGVPETACPDFTGFCDAELQCGYGYTCVQSLAHPVPADAGICRKGLVDRDPVMESCAPDGALSPQQFLDQREKLVGQIVKIAGIADADIKCSNNACMDDPCCKTCVGNYHVAVEDPLDPKRRTEITVDMDSLACNGSNCDVQCGPLTIGDTYLVWGVLEKCNGAARCTILHMGSCPW